MSESTLVHELTHELAVRAVGQIIKQNRRTELDPVVDPTPLPEWCRIVRVQPETFEQGAFRSVLSERPSCRGPQELVELLKPRMAREEVEVFIVVSLDTQHRVIALTEVTRGTIDSTQVHPREAFRVAIAMGAASIVLAHNHPDGNPNPSDADLKVTAALSAAGQIIGIPVFDHIIFGDNKYTSLAEGGRV